MIQGKQIMRFRDCESLCVPSSHWSLYIVHTFPKAKAWLCCALASTKSSYDHNPHKSQNSHMIMVILQLTNKSGGCKLVTILAM